MRRTHLSRVALAACPALAVGLLLSATPAQADTPLPFTAVSDRQTTVRGGEFTLTLTLSNPYDTPIQFVYQSVQPTYQTSLENGLKFTATACGTQTNGCSDNVHGGIARYNVPLAPGATSSFTVTYTVAPDSTCGAATRIDFYSYLYYEYKGARPRTPASSAFPAARSPAPDASPDRRSLAASPSHPHCASPIPRQVPAAPVPAPDGPFACPDAGGGSAPVVGAQPAGPVVPAPVDDPLPPMSYGRYAACPPPAARCPRAGAAGAGSAVGNGCSRDPGPERNGTASDSPYRG